MIALTVITYVLFFKVANVNAARVCLVITRDVTVTSHARGISLSERILFTLRNGFFV